MTTASVKNQNGHIGKAQLSHLKLCFIMSKMPDDSGSKERAQKTHSMKAAVKKKVFSDSLEKQKKNLDTLLKQGDYIMFAEQEKWDPNWKSVAYNFPKGTMKFLLNSFTNTLPT